MCPPLNIYERLISFCSVNLPENYVTLSLDIFLDMVSQMSQMLVLVSSWLPERPVVKTVGQGPETGQQTPCEGQLWDSEAARWSQDLSYLKSRCRHFWVGDNLITDQSGAQIVVLTEIMYCFTSSCQKVGRLKLFMSGLRDTRALWRRDSLWKFMMTLIVLYEQ